jgi:hypothetical protein
MASVSIARRGSHGRRQGPGVTCRIEDSEPVATGTVDPKPMREPTFEHRRLAHAFLALSDDPEPVPPRRSPGRVLCALAGTIVLALAAPLAWNQSAATAAVKGPVAEEADDDDGGGE